MDEVELVSLIRSQELSDTEVADPPNPPAQTCDDIRSSPSTSTDGAKVTFKKELTLVHSIGFIINGIIGSGIFITTTYVLQYSGSMGLTLILWVVGGLIAMAGGLCYCELGTFLPQSGGDYTYIKEAYSFKNRWKWSTFLGSLLAFLYSWVNVISFGTAPIVIAFGRYLASPFFECGAQILVVRLFAIVALIGLCALNSLSVKWSARMMNMLSVFKVLACCFIVALALWRLATDDFVTSNYPPFDNTTKSASSIALGLYQVLFAYSGWNNLNSSTEEVQNVSKTLPKAVVIGVSIVIVCYMCVNLSYFVALSSQDILLSDTIALRVAYRVFGNVGEVAASLIVSLSAFGSANISIFFTSRVMFASARGGQLPDVLSGLHRTWKTPVPSVLAATMVVTVGVLLGSIESLIDAYSAVSWVFYGLSFLGLIIMRVTHKEKHRPYKVWLCVPVVMLLVSVYLVVVPLFQKPIPSLVGFAVILSGVPVYLLVACERWRPRALGRLSEYLAHQTNSLLNTQSSREQ